MLIITEVIELQIRLSICWRKQNFNIKAVFTVASEKRSQAIIIYVIIIIYLLLICSLCTLTKQVT